MIYINPSDTYVLSAKEIHYKNIKCYIGKKIGKAKCKDLKCGICKSSLKKIDNLNPKLFDFFSDEVYLDILINGEPEELENLNKEFWVFLIPGFTYEIISNFFNKSNTKLNIHNPITIYTKLVYSFIYQINKIINYDWFCDKKNKYYTAYELSKNLNRNSCTYCNRIYTSTIINKKGKKIIRPTLDHWFPKSDFPLLALSFYNLIPSCSNCNSSVKGATNFNLKDHIHPYVDVNQTEEFSFNYVYNTTLNNFKISFQDVDSLNSKARNTLEEMYIDEMYNSHQSEISDLIKIKINYSKSYIGSIEKLFGNKLAKEEVYRILFGVEYDTKDFHKLPLSKFKSDILKKLKII